MNDTKKFQFYAGNIFLNFTGIAVYMNEQSKKYILQVENVETGKPLKGYKAIEIDIEEYENLPFDPYNQMVRFNAAMKLCERKDVPYAPYDLAHFL